MIAIVVIPFAILGIEFVSHFTRGATPAGPVANGLEATTLGVVGLVLLVIPLIVSCYREAWETAHARWHASTAKRNLRNAEKRRDRAYADYMEVALELEDDDAAVKRAVATARYDSLQDR